MSDREILQEALRQLALRGLTLAIVDRTRIPARPFTEVGGQEWSPDSVHWVVTLGCERRTLTTCYSTGSAIKGPPSLADVVGCLASDSRAADESFEDWASNMGADTDSRKALATYQACVATRAAMLTLLGSREGLERLMSAEW